ncbi:MAG TPA: hypothetical protein VGM56_32800, partial [Byssovorax sp.]
ALWASFGVAACDDASKAGDAGAGATASAAATSSAAPSPAATAQAGPPADDLDVAALQKQLKCAAEGGSGPCAVLAKLTPCKPWSASSPSGDARWIGRASVVEKGKSTDAFVLVRARRVGTADVGPGQLPVRIAIEELQKPDKSMTDAADRLVRIFERQDVPPRFNAALDYLSKKTDWTEAYATRTAGAQVDVLTSGGAYLCEGPKRQLVLVSRAPGHTAGADGLYAEAWPTTW